MRLIRSNTFLYEKRRGDFTVQVVEREDRRELRFGNHITQSAVSTTDPDFLVLDYTRAMMAGFLFAPGARRMLHIGLGGGSLPRFIHRYYPAARQTAVELSEDVIEIAYRYFYLPVSPRITVVQGDGETFLGSAHEKFDLIFLDAFHAEGVPGNLTTPVFFQEVYSHLERGGWFVNNVWGSDTAKLNRVRNDLGAVFPRLFSVSVRLDSNVIFFASAAGPSPALETLGAAADSLSRKLPLDFRTITRGLTPVGSGI